MDCLVKNLDTPSPEWENNLLFLDNESNGEQALAQEGVFVQEQAKSSFQNLCYFKILFDDSSSGLRESTDLALKTSWRLHCL